MYGWAGTIVSIDLTNRNIVKKPTRQDLALDFLGGEGFGAKWLFDEVPPGTHPFDPQMILVVAVGPLVGTCAPASGRTELISRSPLTGIFGDSNLGGFFGVELKRAGYDALIIRGKADKPVYLWIDDDNIEIRPAEHLWGRIDKFEVEAIIRKEVGTPRVQMLSIGIAGEKGVVYACVSNGPRAAGHIGLGAVVGAKNLKAIVVRGTGGVKIAKPDEFLKVAQECTRKFTASPAYPMWSEPGTIGAIQTYSQIEGIMPALNQQVTWLTPEQDKALSWETFRKRFKVKDLACFGCPMHCSHFIRAKDGSYAGLAREGIEFFSYQAFTENIGVWEPDFAIHMTDVCDRLGMGTMGGCAIGYVCELYQRGLITQKDTDGLDLTWGNTEAFEELLRRTALREGAFGDLMAKGFEEVAKKIGKGADHWLITVHNVTNEDARFGAARGAALMTSTRGADHLKGMPFSESVEGMMPEVDKVVAPMFGIPTLHLSSYVGKEKIILPQENLYAVIDSIGTCKFHSIMTMGLKEGLNFEDYAKMLTPATGVDFDAGKLRGIGERIYRLEMAYNVREGRRRKDFKLPKRYTEEPVPTGPKKGRIANEKEMQKLIDRYLVARGFDPKTALPTREGLEEVGLKYVADDLEKRNLLAKEKA